VCRRRNPDQGSRANPADAGQRAEQGLANFTANTWFAVFLRKGTPASIAQKLNAALLATMETPSVQAQFKKIGAEIVAPSAARGLLGALPQG